MKLSLCASVSLYEAICLRARCARTVTIWYYHPERTQSRKLLYNAL
jgi:hypothetical protein